MTAPLEVLAGLTDQVGRWSEMATDAQVADAEAILSLDGPRRHWLGRAKGYSKTRDVAALSIAALLTQFPGSATGFVAASDADQAGLVRQSIAGFVAGTPGLEGLLTVESRRVSTSAGASLSILPADSAGSHGLRPFWLVVDELANWPEQERHRSFFDSLWAGLPKVSGSRGIVMTTAGAPRHFARRVYEAALEDLAWRVSDLHGPPPWVDPVEVDGERRRLFPSVFQRLWLNEWAAGEDSIADPDDVAAACHLAGPLGPEVGVRYAITLDLGVRNDRTVAVVAHAVPDPGGTRVVVDRLKVWVPRPGAPVSLDEVRLWLVEMARVYGGATVHYDPSQAYLLVEQLRLAGVRCVEFVFSSASVGKLATALMQALRARLLDLPSDDDLRQELLAVRLRETSPNVMRLDHVSGGHDDQAIAVGMAVLQFTLGARPLDVRGLGAGIEAASPDRVDPWGGVDGAGWGTSGSVLDRSERAARDRAVVGGSRVAGGVEWRI